MNVSQMMPEIPDTLIQRTTDLLLPSIMTVDGRKSLCVEAFMTNTRWLLHHLQYEGTPREFTTHCVQTCITNGPQLLDTLFSCMRHQYGVEGAQEIEQLLIDYQSLPSLDHAQPNTQISTQEVNQHPENSPIIYLSYSDKDASIAAQLAKGLQKAGHLCPLRQSINKGSDAWLADVADGLNNAHVVVCLVGKQTHYDHWVQVELLAARDKRKRIIPVRTEGAQLPALLLSDEFTPIDLGTAKDAAFSQLMARLPLPADPIQTTPFAFVSPQLIQRAAELVYMDHLKLAELQHTAQYTRLSGETTLQRSTSGRLSLDPVVARTEFTHVPWRRAKEVKVEQRQFEDAIYELKQIRRAVLLGDPGAGKTTTLYKLASDLIDEALHDATAPIPMMIHFSRWTDANELFIDFFKRSLGELGDGLVERLEENKLVLLLDGINEIPAPQQTAKYQAVKKFLVQHPDVMAIVTCREQDYPAERELGLDRVIVAPLDAMRVFEFVNNYLQAEEGANAGEDLFWKLAGKESQETYKRFVKALGDKFTNPFNVFWLADVLPNQQTWSWDWDKRGNGHWEEWLKVRSCLSSLLLLATNPYMLFMLVDVYQTYDHTLPKNRGQLFDRFVETLLMREGLFKWDDVAKQLITYPEGLGLLKGLTELAYAMQVKRQGNNSEQEALTTLTLADTVQYLDETQRYYAASANLLTLGQDVHFAHQLLQEYFVARAMRDRILKEVSKTPTENLLQAEEIWSPDSWWQPTNWEEATILLAGLYSDDCSWVLEWVGQANPELAARCIVESGAKTPDETKKKLRDLWIPRLTDLKREPSAQARAAIGRALGKVTLEDGMPLDNRSGVSVIIKNDFQIPDIEWGKVVPRGRYLVGGDERAYRSFKKQSVWIKRPYQLACYPITYAQFDCFVQAVDFADRRWWKGMPSKKKVHGTIYEVRQLSDQSFPFSNHPREKVSWYQAIAFCRWLSDKLGYEVDLPHEHEWEVAARYPDGRFYPWGNTFDVTTVNTGEGDNLNQTSAVGIYPNGMNTELGLHDLSGNVFEWCRNKYGDVDSTVVDRSSARRVIRGGAWNLSRGDARGAYRGRNRPSPRSDSYGFRLVRRLPPSR